MFRTPLSPVSEETAGDEDAWGTFILTESETGKRGGEDGDRVRGTFIVKMMSDREGG